MKFAWSYSSLDLFKLCPRKYHELKVTKNFSEPQTIQITYGNELHKAAELYGKNDTPLPDRFSFIEQYVNTLKQMPGHNLYEYRMGITEQLNPCKFFAEDVWCRSIADFVNIPENGNVATVVDYKTGNPKYAKTDQLELLALNIFIHFPVIEYIQVALLFPAAEHLIDDKISRKDSVKLWDKWTKDVDRLRGAFEEQIWNPSINFTCRNYCPVTNCEHNGRS